MSSKGFCHRETSKKFIFIDIRKNIEEMKNFKQYMGVNKTQPLIKTKTKFILKTTRKRWELIFISCNDLMQKSSRKE